MINTNSKFMKVIDSALVGITFIFGLVMGILMKIGIVPLYGFWYNCDTVVAMLVAGQFWHMYVLMFLHPKEAKAFFMGRCPKLTEWYLRTMI